MYALLACVVFMYLFLILCLFVFTSKSFIVSRSRASVESSSSLSIETMPSAMGPRRSEAPSWGQLGTRRVEAPKWGWLNQNVTVRCCVWCVCRMNVQCTMHTSFRAVRPNLPRIALCAQTHIGSRYARYTCSCVLLSEAQCADSCSYASRCARSTRYVLIS